MRGFPPQQPPQYPPGQPPANQPPNYGGPGYGGGSGGPPPGSSGGDAKKKGTVITLLIALVVVIAGTIGFVVTRPDDNEPASSDDVPGNSTVDTGSTVTESTVPDQTSTTSTTPTSTTTTVPTATGSVDGVVVHIDARAALVDDAELDSTLQRIGLSTGDNPVSTPEPVVNLCAAIAIDEPVNARVEWSRDGATVLENPTRPFAVPADGNCINNNGDPLENGSYEVFFTDDAGGQSRIALFTVGAATRSQVFLNDTGLDICFIDLSPSVAGFYQSFEPTGDTPLLDGETIAIDIADVEHDLRGVDCDGNELDAVGFVPGDDPISLTSGAGSPPTTEPPPQITDDELSLVEGVIGSFGTAVEAGSPEETAFIDQLAAPGPPLPIASTDPSLTLCSAWFVGGPLEAEAVWEFNGEDFAREPVVVTDGVAGSCIPPKGVAQFGEGAYQVYLQRDGVSSTVQTYTVGRAQTQLGFVNDTGVDICAVGFSPTLTGFYTFYAFADSDDFGDALPPDEAFTIVAPFIENDIQARDCDGNVVAENFDIPPTDQTLRLTTGQP